MTTIDLITRAGLEALRDEDGWRIHVAASGAGAGLQALLWSVPGCSRLLSGASFPYAQGETDLLLGHSPGRYASCDAAVDLAIAAYLRARRAADAGRDVAGVGIAASAASQEAHRGDHRAHVAVITSRGHESVRNLVLAKGAGQQARDLDAETVDLVGLDRLMRAVCQDGLSEHDRARAYARCVSGTDEDGASGMARFLDRLLANPVLLARGGTRPSSDLDQARTLGRLLVHPGTFDPPHAGHVEGARAALEAFHAEEGGRIRPGAPARRLVHSLTMDPPNKPALYAHQVLDRAALLGAMGGDMLVTRGDPLFVQKAERLPGAAFVVGADTVVRMLDPRWGPAPAEVLERLMRADARLYVVGRQVTSAAGLTQFVDVGHPWITELVPFDLRFLLKHVPGRWDVSSSELRASQAATQNNLAK